MKTNYKITKILLCGILLTSITNSKASAKEVLDQKTNRNVEQSVQLSFSEKGKPRALDYYWHKMAQCETGTNWKNKGRWSGGLGIFDQTWKGYGGKEFAPKPELATIDEQIIIANRISTQGYQTKDEYWTYEQRETNKPFFRPAVGFGGWGCKKNVGNPALFKKFPSKTLLRNYKLGERNKYVYGIQVIIGVKVDGYFGPITDKAYNKFFSKYRKYIMAEYEKYNQPKDLG